MAESQEVSQVSEKSPDARQLRGERTRQALLDAAFEEIHRHGYRSASLNDILKAAGCTKGSLYHHFPDKHALGLAAIADNIDRFLQDVWLTPLAETNDPVETLKTIISRHANSNNIPMDITLGCPIQNLSQEMAGLDEDFRIYLNNVQHKWADAIVDALKRGQANGLVRPDIDPEAVATMVIATHQGTVGLIKTAQDPSVGRTCAKAFFQFIDSLRPEGPNMEQAS